MRKLKKWLAGLGLAAAFAGGWFCGSCLGYGVSPAAAMAECATATAAEMRLIETAAARHLPQIPLSSDVQNAIRDAASENGVPYALVLGVIEQESQFDYTAEYEGCYGLMQIHSVHAPRYILLDPFENVKIGCWLLGAYFSKYGNWDKALVVYNCGETGAYNYYFQYGKTSSEYSRTVLLRAAKWARALGEKSVLYGN